MAAQNPAVNANACAQAGGVFVSSGPPPHNSCTVGGGTTVERVPASHPTNCFNGSGQSIGGFETNPNCQPAGGTS